MSAQSRDPIFESLDRLAGEADRDFVGDRMPDIRRRVRAARRRRTTGVGIAAAGVVVSGLGVWQVVSADDSVPDPARPTGLEQTVSIEAEGTYADVVRVSFTVEGRSSAYVDPATGAAVPAGPLSYVVLVDGEVKKRIDGAAAGGTELACEQGGAVTSYSAQLPRRKNGLGVVVSGPGEHVVEVRAPYCADGELVDEPTKVTVTTEVGRRAVTGVHEADLDGDGQLDTARLLIPSPDATGADQELVVDWGAGGTATAALPNDMERRLESPRDLDGDGRPELIVSGGGGELGTWAVYRVTGSSLVAVTTVDEAGKEVPLNVYAIEGAAQNETWQVDLLPDGFYSYRYDDAVPQRPAPVQVREWVLVGDTMTLQDATGQGCMDEQFQLQLRSC